MFPCRAASYPFQSLSCWRAEGHQEEMHCNFIHINSTLEYLTRAVGYKLSPKTGPWTATAWDGVQDIKEPISPKAQKSGTSEAPLFVWRFAGVEKTAQRVAGGCLSQSSHALASASFLESTTAMIALPLSALPYPSTS